MPIFKKRPVIIEAHQLPPPNETPTLELVEFLHDAPVKITSERDGGVAIHTLEGVMTAGPGDWIIRGVEGEYYPCKPEIFEKTYKLVSDTGCIATKDATGRFGPVNICGIKVVEGTRYCRKHQR